jgi:hypothetical protein
VTPGLALAYGVAVGRLSFELVATSFLPANHDAPAKPATGGTFLPLAIGGSLCGAVVARATVRAGGCVGLEVQGMWVSGYGTKETSSAAVGWGAPTVTPFFSARLFPALWLATRLDAAFPLNRPSFSITNVGSVYTVGTASLRGSVGLELDF